jgi:hypothetical protein
VTVYRQADDLVGRCISVTKMSFAALEVGSSFWRNVAKTAGAQNQMTLWSATVSLEFRRRFSSSCDGISVTDDVKAEPEHNLKSDTFSSDCKRCERGALAQRTPKVTAFLRTVTRC